MRAAYDQMAASKFAVVMNGFDGREWQEAIESLPRQSDTPPARRESSASLTPGIFI